MPDNSGAVRETVQSRVRAEAQERLGLLLWLSTAGELIPPWWSTRRDKELRAFYKRVDYLAGAVYALSSHMTTIPWQIVPYDLSVLSHQSQADRFEDVLMDGAEFGRGWTTFFSKWVTDLLTQDNGAFAEIIGEGDPVGPIVGQPISIANLDAGRCTRTSSAEFPVIYQDTDGARYKLHYTRVAFASLDPSPIAEMNDVGLCAVSKCLNVAQNLYDMTIYKQEKLGSRPARGLMVTKGGLDPEHVREAIALANETQNNQGLSRYSKTIVVGDAGLKEAGIDLIDLASMPDGFNEQDTVSLGMAAIALAFGVDARELWPMTGTGATRADALIQHLKARQKGIGQLIELTERVLSQKFLPPHLSLVFDYTDDAQDRQVAEIRKVRSERHSIAIADEVMDIRTVREQMLNDGDLTQEQFNDLERDDGRMEDGSPIVSLFYDPQYADMLAMGIPNPVDVESNDEENVMTLVCQKRAELIQALGVVANYRKREQVMNALAAVEALAQMYQGEPEPPEPTEPQEDMPEEDDGEEAEGEVAEPEAQEDEEEGAADEDLTDMEDGEVKELRPKKRGIRSYIARKAIEIPPVIVQVPEQRLPDIRVDVPAPVVNVTVEPPPPTVVNVAAPPAPNVTVQAPPAPVVNVKHVPPPIENKVEVHVFDDVEENISVVRNAQNLITAIRKTWRRKK